MHEQLRNVCLDLKKKKIREKIATISKWFSHSITLRLYRKQTISQQNFLKFNKNFQG